MILHPFQQEAVDTLWREARTQDRLLCVLPTGTGKTEIFIRLLEMAKGTKACVLLNREKLVSQTVRRLDHLNPGVYSAAHNSWDLSQTLTVASIQSIFKQSIPGLKLIIMDEAHNIGVQDGMYDQFLKANPCKIIGFTATPYRETGLIYGEDKPFPEINFVRSVKFMIGHSHIVRPTMKAPPHQFDTKGLRITAGDFNLADIERITLNRPKVSQQVRDALSRLNGRHKIVWVCSSIEHCEMVRAEIFEDSCIIHSKMTNAQTDLQLKAFEEGSVRHMLSVMMITEGYDFPSIDAIVLMRPTKSARLMVQVIGRGLRKSQGKENCLVLDYGQVIQNCGPIDNPIIGNKRESKKDPLEQLVKVCPSCLSIVGIDALECPDCSHEFKCERQDHTTKAHEEGLILHVPLPLITEVVQSVKISQHISKKTGNKCIKIEYYTGNRWPRTQYFTSHPYSWTKAVGVLSQLMGFKFNVTFEGAFNTLPFVNILPAAILVDTNGQYPEIKKLIFERNTDRASDTDIPEFP